MTEAIQRAADAMIERGSFYAEFVAIVIAAVLMAVLTFGIRRMKSAGLWWVTRWVLTFLGVGAVYVLSCISALVTFDHIYNPFALTSWIDDHTLVSPPLWVHPSFSRLAVLLSMSTSAIVFTILTRKDNKVRIESNAEQVAAADGPPGRR